MPVDVVVPSVGESITEGTLSRWLKKDGDVVRADDPLFELETDKATTEIAAPAAGRLSIAVSEGASVVIGAVVGRIEAAATADGLPVPEAPRPKTAEVHAVAQAGQPTDAAATRDMDKNRAPDAGPQPKPATKGVDLEVTKTHAETTSTFPAVPDAKIEVFGATQPRETRQRMNAIRQRIAERLVAAQQSAAILTTFNEADMSAIIAIRDKYKDSFKQRHGVNLGFMSFFVKACIEALKAFPAVNARIDGPDIVYHHYYNLGVAVSTDKGLMVPVVRDADRLSFAQIEKTIAGLAQKARDSKISVNDLQGGTFTITNGGIFGSLLSTPILNPPQVGILGMHAIQKRPVAVNEQVVIRPMMYLALSYDHRLIDGREAVQFLVRVKECLENPERMMLEL